MINILDARKRNFENLLDDLIYKRKSKANFNSYKVKKILNDIKKNGDTAILKYERKFSKNSKIISKSNQIQKQIGSLDKKIKNSIDLSFNRILRFHLKQKVKNIYYKDKLKNKLNYKYIPLESVGIYVPGGTAAYPSTVLMNAIPALIAGVKRIVMVNPAYNGKQNAGVLYAAKKNYILLEELKQ